MADDVTHYDAVEAYCDRLSYAPGDVVRLHAWCATERYDVSVSRWGGDGPASPVWSATDLAGVAHPTPDTADASGCGWPSSLEIPVAADWRSGAYLVTLHAHGAVHERAVGHALFVVRAARPTSPMLLVLATNTYNAYNNWGGRSLYTGGHQVSFDRPFGRGLLMRPRVDNIDRKSPVTAPGAEPDTDGAAYQEYRWANGYPGYMSSSGWFAYERRFVEWAESQGIEFDYAVSSDLEQRPSVVGGYRLVLGVGHDEYWSAAQRDTIERHVADGGNYASFSGNTMFWQVRLSRGGRDMTAYKYRAHRDDPVLGTDNAESMSGMWCDPVVGRPEWWFLGAGSAFGLYSRFGRSTPRASGGFTVYRDTHWMLEGTGLRYGDQLGAAHGAVGYETVGCRLGFDEYGLPVSVNPDRPPDIEVVAFAPSSNLGAGDYPASVAASSEQCDLEFVASRLYGDESADSIARVRHGNAVMLTCRPSSAGTVATIGSTDWVYALADPAVGQVTRNVLQRLSR
ncbi:MAG: hypothetical protein RJB61_1807 [Actinomycetota bacterium]